MGEDSSAWGVPGTLVTRRALDQHGYLDARSYLKTPRIFGFHGVYKRLATHLGLVDVHLGAGPNAEGLVDAWARGLGLSGLEDAKPMLSRWTVAVRRSLAEKPPHTRPNWGKEAWAELAGAFAPASGKSRERRYLRDLLNAIDDRRLGALPILWQLQAEFDDDGFREELLHDRLEQREPGYGPLLAAIRAYEAFARSLQDAFDVLKAEAAKFDALGCDVPKVARVADFKRSVQGLHARFEAAYQALGKVTLARFSLQNLFAERFTPFVEPLDAATYALALCTHHETVQRAKSADGKRPWFDRLGQNSIYVRHAYRQLRSALANYRFAHLGQREYRAFARMNATKCGGLQSFGAPLESHYPSGKRPSSAGF